MSSTSTSPKKPLAKVHLLQNLDLLRVDLYDLPVFLRQFIEYNTEAPNNINSKKLMNLVKFKNFFSSPVI